MRRFKYLIASSFGIVIAALLILPLHVRASNLITNSSVETNSSGQPTGWSTSAWGTNNASHTYVSSGHTGSKSLKVEMTTHTDGDAKWMHDEVDVSPDTTYTYTSYYKSNVATEIDLQYRNTSNSLSYVYVQSVGAASSNWTKVTATFTTPTNVDKVVVMHILAAPGWLQTDDFTLEESTAPATGNNLLANPSFEDANNGNPESWSSSHWGTNTPGFTYENTGRTGNRSVKVNVVSHTDGDAKWYAEPVAVQEGKSYTYIDYYKSSVTTRVVAAFIDDEDNYSYMELDNAAAAVNWTQYHSTFTTPLNTEKVTIYHLVDSVGTLTIDDTNLMYNGQPPVDGENIVANPSMETAAGSNPEDWTSNSWGTNTASYVYETTGRTGSRSVSTTISSYTDGDAKWYFEPVDVLPSTLYYYMDYYKASAATRVVVAFIDSSNGYTYQELAGAPIAGDWTQYVGHFVTPTGTEKVAIYHLIDTVGTLTLDDVSLVREPDPLPVNNVTGQITSNTTWTAGSVYMVSNALTVTNNATLTIEAGTIVKFNNTNNYYGINVDTGSELNVEGDPESKVIFTSFKDDSAGGDSNADGLSVGSAGDYYRAIRPGGGVTSIDYATIKYASLSIDAQCSSTSDISVTSSLIESQMLLYQCGKDKVTLQRNEFRVTGNYPIAASYSVVTGISLSGSTQNKFRGEGISRTIYIGASSGYIEDNSEWTVSGSSRAILFLAGSSLSVEGVLNLIDGAIVKSGASIIASGEVNVMGTSTNPVIFTSLKDDSAGGDSNDDGNASAPAHGDFMTSLQSIQGGIIDVGHAVFKYGDAAISNGSYTNSYCSAGELYVRDSLFKSGLLYNNCGHYDLISLERNEFNVDSGFAISVGFTDPTGITLTGADKNTFNGSGSSKVLRLAASYSGYHEIGSGKEWEISSEGGAVVLIEGVVRVEGVLDLKPGAILKVANNGITVSDSGHINAEGTPIQPVVITSVKDDAVGGDSNGDSATTLPAVGDYGSAINLAGGDAFLKGMDLRYSSWGLEASGDAVAIIRGKISPTLNGISACRWDQACNVDASYVDWGRTDGPFMSTGNNLACGSVVVSPWTVGSSTSSTNFGSIKNCDGSSLVDNLDSAASGFNSAIAAKQIDCSGGMQDACNAISNAFACYSAAINIAASQSPIPVTFNNPTQNNDDSRTSAMDAVSNTMDAASVVNPSSYTNATKIRVGNAMGLFGALYSAYNSCRP
jgi:hypothetical protein